MVPFHYAVGKGYIDGVPDFHSPEGFHLVELRVLVTGKQGTDHDLVPVAITQEFTGNDL